ncbi:MAG TPA: hypothetical protein VGW78_00995 [Candidatus Babeliales bacterium]|jgi:hypothetical protein|nr:hypothetical protein [Candidatus Babeliales bacterium]
MKLHYTIVLALVHFWFYGMESIVPNQKVPNFLDTIPSEVCNEIHTYINYQNLFELRLVDKSYYNYIIGNEELLHYYKQRLYNTLAEKLSKLDVPKCVHDFNIYWHARYGTLFLKEKITDEDFQMLKKAKRVVNGANHGVPSFPEKLVCALQNNKFDHRKIAPDARIVDDPKPFFSYTVPLVNRSDSSIIIYNGKWGREIQDIPILVYSFDSGFIDSGVYIYNRKYDGRLWYYPRLLEASIGENYSFSSLSPVNKPQLLLWKDKNYQAIIDKNFSLDNDQIYTYNDLLILLFAMHSGDCRPRINWIDYLIKKFYHKQWPSDNKLLTRRYFWRIILLHSLCSVDDYCNRVRATLYKVPTSKQIKHIDDFDKFKKKLVSLGFDSSLEFDSRKSLPEQKNVLSYKELLKGYCASVFNRVKLLPSFLYKPIQLLRYCYTLLPLKYRLY